MKLGLQLLMLLVCKRTRGLSVQSVVLGEQEAIRPRARLLTRARRRRASAEILRTAVLNRLQRSFAGFESRFDYGDTTPQLNVRAIARVRRLVNHRIVIHQTDLTSR